MDNRDWQDQSLKSFKEDVRAYAKKFNIPYVTALKMLHSDDDFHIVMHYRKFMDYCSDEIERRTGESVVC